jgi:FdrA protein
MTLAGMRALLDDPATGVVVVVSKPPHPDVAARVWEAASGANKPLVFCFLGMDPAHMAPHARAEGSRLSAASTLEDAARRAVALSGIAPPPTDTTNDPAIQQAQASLQPTQRYLRGLFSGGTFCYEAMLVLQPELGSIYSNTPLSADLRLELQNPKSTIQNRHACLDLGSDEFTVGRPHPMIDMSARAERILLEAADPEVAVLLLDVVLGYGAHPDPAGALAPAIAEAKSRAQAEGRALAVVASICGTKSDPQGFDAQRRKLEEAGVILAGSNAAAARVAGAIIARSFSSESE